MLAVTPATLEQLIARSAAGDRAAFETLARRWTPLALRLAAKVLPEPADAEDAVQAALINLWRKAASFDPARGSAEGWFRRLVVNAALDRKRTIRPVQPLEDASQTPSLEPTPEVAAEKTDEAARLKSALSRLNPRQRAAIAMFYGGESSTIEVAEALETTPKAIEGLLARARQDLARILNGMRKDR